jgi:very-short-patch-repair endonuclease
VTASAQLLVDLLSYIEQVEKLKSKPVFTVPTEFFHAYQAELRGLPAIQFNVHSDEDDVWLKLPRLLETSAPAPGEALKDWISLSKSPDKRPELKSEVVVAGGRREVARETLESHPEINPLFEQYVNALWEPWAAAERPRRKSIALYNKLFALQQTLAIEGAEAPIELVWGIGQAVWKKAGAQSEVRHPLLTQACEISLNTKSFDLEVRPRELEPFIELDCYSEMDLPGVAALEAQWKGVLATGANPVNPFEPSTFENTLKAAVGHLDPSGAYLPLPQAPTPPAPTEKLVVTDTWVLFARKRSEHIFLRDIERLKKNVVETKSLPAVLESLVIEGSSEVKPRPEVVFRGLSSSFSSEGVRELFFPMPYNDEQVSIVRKLESNNGVVVQGPPGTGKTHTIANVICHFLAQGKRVLVTAKSESALAVLQEKLPAQIRPLSVALLSDERDGVKQFEHSIQTIATRVSSLDADRTRANITAFEARLNQLHARISAVDGAVSDFATKHMTRYPFGEDHASPEQLAKHVLENAAEYGWLDDEGLSRDADLKFTDSDISSLRKARIAARADLGYLGQRLPVLDDFPSWPELLSIHRDLARAKAIQGQVKNGEVLPLVDSTVETFQMATSLAASLDTRMQLLVQLKRSGAEWAGAFESKISVLPAQDPVFKAFETLCATLAGLEQERRELLAKAVVAPPDAESNVEFQGALARLLAGKKPFALPIGNAETRRLVAAVTVGGMAPGVAAEWEQVAKLLKWRTEAKRQVAQWNSIASELSLPAFPQPLEQAFGETIRCQAVITDIRTLAKEHNRTLSARVNRVFGNAVSLRLVDKDERHVTSIAASLTAHLERGRLAYAASRVASLQDKLKVCQGQITSEMLDYLSLELGQPNATETTLSASWQALGTEVLRLTRIKPALDEIARVSALIEEAGGVLWVKRLRTEPALEDSDPQTPAKWLEAWNWRGITEFLSKIDGHNKLKNLFEERRTLTLDLAKTYQELVAEKTWLGVSENSPETVRQSLQKYLNAVQSMGSGKGLRAVRYRKTAREAMGGAYLAVPCWVLPLWRVSEALPSEVGLFDLVVIDEASQADIWALPALMRGKKLLVVGDHKQVSPSAVGTEEARIKDLVHRYLGNQPFGADMTPEKSIYDLARVVFAGNSVMLKEHFRCVPAIIELCNREFYQGEIRPLRLPAANERLDPPLIDVFVKGGYRKGDTNPAEALAIVDEIKALLADERFAGRTIGVVTLRGTEQAAHINKLINERLSPLDVLERKIAVGPPPVFQGRERDIMMVSMVIAQGDAAAQTRAEIEQRFNVALSRARDRMYLFRSVPESYFNATTLNAKLIRHFRQPFTQDVRRVDELRARCESGFEREVFDLLVQRNYRVEPQVKCGGYRIDFVVEGAEGRRLAVECDGDRFHGPGQWGDDMARQRVLERAGWTFWRCFASSFVMRRDAVVADLVETLQQRGIEPLGSESVDNTVWVHQKEVDPFAVEQLEAETLAL